ncbi:MULTISPECIES: 5-guanidino-2-oxopentanoate decarboxylase [unclassified Halomonas]|uniref:5-guanidino-2-oxopentanoate decarboxylase n=1 Tax=unclassified Halomonas TaxID=2609666 RepID=UPI001C977523|nr:MULTISPECIES: 5-guanidino-2-oxopentanoate decarboxylase [unclassified Halomonas]MBY5925018.1 5-guanidino-2-oxopentanoate decarboxylase [Halomonas sp. DP4Y7-2]MBY6232059.1 5-guanidino-2-oxopentanoate decarboxylase [Halomonas sp. DP4Y7-1]
MLTCGEALVQLLEAYGVDTVFGIPGVHTVELYRGLPATRITHVTPRHEQGAGFMADGYARVTGKPGTCFIISGPGMTNILTAMGQAYADSVPMLVISSVNRREQLGLGEGRLHELPSQRNMVAGVSAFSHTLQQPDELPRVLARAFAVFRGARPRPVHIEIPIDVITAPADHLELEAAALPAPPAPDTALVDAAAELLATAKQPVVLLGGGAADHGEAARALVEALDAPTTCTVNAKGLLPKGHPLALGSTQSLDPVRKLVREADVVLAIGTELGETDYDAVFDGNFRIDGRLIRVDIDAEQLQRNHLAHLAIVSDAGRFMQALLERISIPSATPSATPAAAATPTPGQQRVADIQRQLAPEWPPAWRTQQRVLELVQRTLPGAIVVGDSTQPVYSGNFLYEAESPRSWFNSSTGYGTLGYGLPAAIGAKLAAPNRPVVSLIGDGGIQFTLPELASAVETKTPIVILLWNNQGYGEIKRYMQEREIPTIGVDIYTPDLVAIARGYGCEAHTATGLDHLERLLQQAKEADGPWLIEVREEGDFA